MKIWKVCLIASQLLLGACTSIDDLTASNGVCSVGLSGIEGGIGYTDTPPPCYTGTGGSTGYTGLSGAEGSIGY